MQNTIRQSPLTNEGLKTGHVGINVTDLARAKSFYRNVFGFEVAGEGAEPERRFAFLSDNARLVLTLWEQSAGRFDKTLPGLHHLSFQVETIEQVKEAERRVRAEGVPLYHDGIVPHSEGATSGGIFFEDPDGTRLEIYAPADVTGTAPSGAAPTCGFF
ncbi:MAG: VOC family protein [Armatimonadetes bacterium]|nr:VOC family protein [Armatimonadota bacterium]